MNFKRILLIILVFSSFLKCYPEQIEYIAPNEEIISGNMYLISLAHENDEESTKNSLATLQNAYFSGIRKFSPQKNETIGIDGQYYDSIHAIPLKQKNLKNSIHFIKIGIKWNKNVSKKAIKKETFPKYWPIELIEILHENDSLYLKLNGKTVKLTASQKSTGNIFSFQIITSFLKKQIELKKQKKVKKAFETRLNLPKSEDSVSPSKFNIKNIFYSCITLGAISACAYYTYYNFPKILPHIEKYCAVLQNNLFPFLKK